MCLYCTLKDHVGHRFDLVEKAASECRNMLTKTTAPLVEISKSLSIAESNIFSTQEKVKEQASEINQEIDKSYEE